MRRACIQPKLSRRQEVVGLAGESEDESTGDIGLFGARFVGMWVVPAMTDIPKSGKTCVGKVGRNTRVCVSSNGSTLSSSYNWRGSVATRGSHTSCSASGNTITCKSGRN